MAPSEHRMSVADIEQTGYAAVCVPTMEEQPGCENHSHLPGEPLRDRTLGGLLGHPAPPDTPRCGCPKVTFVHPWTDGGCPVSGPEPCQHHSRAPGSQAVRWRCLRVGCGHVEWADGKQPTPAATATVDKAQDPVRRKALEVLRNGRVCVLRAERLDGSPPVPWFVVARVASSQGGYREVLRHDGRWECSHDDQRGGDCKHVRAVRMVTGWAP